MNRKTINKLRAILMLSILILLAVLYQRGLLTLPGTESSGTGGNSAVPPTAPAARTTPVRATVVHFGPLSEYITVSGSTVPSDEVIISPEVPGIITEIAFREGAMVNKGDLLVSLDDSELAAQLHRLEVAADLNRRIAERLEGLYARKGVSLQEYEIAVAEYDKSKADIELVRTQLAKREIRAPFRGRLGLKQVSRGAFVSPGAAIVSLVRTDPLKVEFSVPEKYSTAIGPGTPVAIEVGYLDAPLPGKVEAADPVIDPDTRSWTLRAVTSNPEGAVLPGAFAQVKVRLKEFESTAIIPTEAIIPELGGKKVYVYRNGEARAVSVSTGIRQESMIQITEGLHEGDTVITTGILQIREGSPVTITELAQESPTN